MLMFDFVSASFPLIGTRGRDYVPHFGNLSTIPHQKKNTRISLKKHHFSIFLLAILVLCCKLSNGNVQSRSGFHRVSAEEMSLFTSNNPVTDRGV